MGRMGIIHIDFIPEFKPGDPPPTGYVARSEWADVQLAAGLKQRKCPGCGKWKFPQESCCQLAAEPVGIQA